MISNRTPAPRPMWLWCLLLTTFVVGTDDFLVAGVLPDVAADLRIEEAAAGQLVTVFSVTYAVAAPVLAVATARMSRRALIAGGLAMFAALNVAAALAPSYAVLMALRVAAALVAAVIGPAAFGVAGRLADPARLGRAIGTVAAGLTLALIIGVPVGTWLGTTTGWRAAFGFVAGFAVVVGVVAVVALPRLPGVRGAGVGEQLRLLAQPPVLLSAAATVCGATGGLMTYTYIAPVTRDLTGAEGPILAVFIAIAGIAGAAGTVLGGRLTDRWAADRTLIVAFCGQLGATVALVGIGFLGGGTAPAWTVAAALALWGLAGWAYNPPMNTRAHLLGGAAGPAAMALNTSGLYLGVAFGGAFGGTALAGGGGNGVVLLAAAVGAGTLALLAWSVRRYPSGHVPSERTADAREAA